MGGALATAFRVLPGAPRVVWVWLTGDREGCLVMTAPAFGFL